MYDEFFWTIQFSGRRHPTSISTFHSSILDIFYDPTEGSPGSSPEEVQTVAVGRNTYGLPTTLSLVTENHTNNNWDTFTTTDKRDTVTIIDKGDTFTITEKRDTVTIY